MTGVELLDEVLKRHAHLVTDVERRLIMDPYVNPGQPLLILLLLELRQIGLKIEQSAIARASDFEVVAGRLEQMLARLEMIHERLIGP